MAQPKWTEAKGKMLLDYVTQEEVDRLVAGDPCVVDVKGTDMFVVLVPPQRHAEFRAMAVRLRQQGLGLTEWDW